MLLVLSFKSWNLEDSNTISSAKSRSSNVVVKSHLIPLLTPVVVFFITQSIARRKRNPDITHPCFTPVFYLEPLRCFVFLDDCTLKPLMNSCYCPDDLNLDYIVLHYGPKTLSVYRVECFFKVDEMCINRCSSFICLLQNIPQDKNLLRGPPSRSKSCSFLPESPIYSFLNPIDDHTAEDFADNW